MILYCLFGGLGSLVGEIYYDKALNNWHDSIIHRTHVSLNLHIYISALVKILKLYVAFITQQSITSSCKECGISEVVLAFQGIPQSYVMFTHTKKDCIAAFNNCIHQNGGFVISPYLFSFTVRSRPRGSAFYKPRHTGSVSISAIQRFLAVSRFFKILMQAYFCFYAVQ